MKTRSFAILTLLFTIILQISSFSQSKILGHWEGMLDVGSKKIKIILHITQTGKEVKSLMDSPEQGAVNLPFEQSTISGDSLKLADTKMRISINGVYMKAKDSIDAFFLQRGNTVPISFGRSSSKEFVLNRPQTPKPPYPYKSEDVTFTNKAAENIKLAGTLTIPSDQKVRCTVILITGSGPQNRNEKAFDHEPFLVLSDFLSRNGIAVLRFDDRGIGESQGNYKTATSYDFSTDVEAALDYLKSRPDINPSTIGLLGHSEGGLIAPMVAARRSDVAFIISLAGPGVPIKQLMLKQIEDLSRAEKQADTSISKNLKMNSEIFTAIDNKITGHALDSIIIHIMDMNNFLLGDSVARAAFVKRTTSPWYLYFVSYNPEIALHSLACPFLALDGTLDKQVDAAMNLENMRAVLKNSKCPDYSLQYMEGLNHAFQEAKTGSVAEYRMIEQTMSPKAMDTILQWMKERF